MYTMYTRDGLMFGFTYLCDCIYVCVRLGVGGKGIRQAKDLDELKTNFVQVQNEVPGRDLMTFMRSVSATTYTQHVCVCMHVHVLFN